MNFELTFHYQNKRPTEEGEYLLWNQCDGFHIAEACFDEQGVFECFKQIFDVDEDFYVAWAKLPDSVTLYDQFADKPRDGASAHDVAMDRLAKQAQD